MSSETLTDVRLKRDAADREQKPAGAGDSGHRRRFGFLRDRSSNQALQPWQFFVLAGLSCATVVTFMARGQGMTVVVLLTVLMGATALVGLAVLGTVRPLVRPDHDRTAMIGDRTRAALEREKLLALRSIKELEFDRAMGKIAEDDFKELGARLRARAIRLMRQLDAGSGYRDRIEQDLAKRLGSAVAPPVRAARVCGSCATTNDSDAKFCKQCGAPV